MNEWMCHKMSEMQLKLSGLELTNTWWQQEVFLCSSPNIHLHPQVFFWAQASSVQAAVSEAKSDCTLLCTWQHGMNPEKKKKKKALVQNREQQPALPCHTVHALIHNCLFLVSVMMLFTWPCSKPERQSVSPWKIKHADQKHFRFPLK